MSYTYNPTYTSNTNPINTNNYNDTRATEPIQIYQIPPQVQASTHQISTSFNPVQSPQFNYPIHTDERPNLNTYTMRQAPPAPFISPAQQYPRHAYYVQQQQPRMPTPHHNYPPQQIMMMDGYQVYSQPPRPQMVPQMISAPTVQSNNTHVPPNTSYYEPTYPQQPQIPANPTYQSYNIQFNPNAPGWTPNPNATMAPGIIPPTSVVASQTPYRQETTQPPIIQQTPPIVQQVVPPVMGPVKREKKPIQIINPQTHEPIDPTKPNNTINSTTNINDKSTHHTVNNTDSLKTNTTQANSINRNTQKPTSTTTSTSSTTTATTTNTNTSSTSSNSQTVDPKTIQSEFSRQVIRKINESENKTKTEPTTTTTITSNHVNSITTNNESITTTSPATTIPAPPTTATTQPITKNENTIIEDIVNKNSITENNDNNNNSSSSNTSGTSNISNVTSNRPGANVPRTAIPVGRNPPTTQQQQQPSTQPSTKPLNAINKQDNKIIVSIPHGSSTTTTPQTTSVSIDKTIASSTTNNNTEVNNTEKTIVNDKLDSEVTQVPQEKQKIENKLENNLKEDTKNDKKLEINLSEIDAETSQITSDEDKNSNPDPIDESKSSNTMKDRHSLDSSTWRPDQTDAKKRYDRDFLLKMKDKQTGKPEGLPSIPNVIIDNLNKPDYQSQLSQSYSSYPSGGRKSMESYGRGSMGRPARGGGKGNKGSQHGKPVYNIPLQHDVKLNTTENAYKPVKMLGVQLDETQNVLRNVRAILNKLTPNNFQKLVNDLVQLEINADEERLRGTIDIIFEKSIDEPGFSQTYANLCKALVTIKAPSSNDPTKTTNFRSLLLSRCQREFETDFYREINYDEEKKAVDEEKDEIKRKEKQELLDEKLSKAKRRSLGNIRFIGELFKLNMLTEGIMHDCINRLLKQESDEENLECLCKLLTTIGKDMDKPQSAKQMKEHFDRLDKIKRNKASTISSRIRFMILDVIELRQNTWVPRRVDNAPKLIAEIHREIEEENKQKQIEIDRLNLLEAQKRAATQGQQRGGGRGGHHQQSGLKSASMDSETFAANRPKTTNIGSKLSDVKKLTTINTEIQKFGPPSFNKPSAQKPTEQRSTLTASHNESDLRRGSMPLGGSRPNKQYSQQTSQEMNRKLEKVKQMDRSEASSQASSRDGSLNRQDQSRDNSVSRASDTSICGSNPHISDVMKPIIRKTYTSGEIDRKANNMIEEYMQNDDINEALKDIEEFQPINPEQIEEFVRVAVQVVLERSESARKSLGKLFYHALKEKKLDPKRFTSGLREIFESADDMSVDIPRVGKYLGELIAPLVQEGFNIEFLNDLFSATDNMKILGDVISESLHCASNRLGHTSVNKIFKSSKVNVNEHLKNHPNLTEFLKEKNLLWIVVSRERTQSVSISSDSYESRLFEILEEANAENESIFDQIENNFSDQECKTKQFVRALMTAVCRSCISDNKIDHELFKKRGLILSKYIARNDILELESLFAIQGLDHRLQHPPGFIRVIFDILYDEDIISEDAFRLWQTTDREDGHAICVLSLKAFFEWLDEAEASEP